jgi:integrase
MKEKETTFISYLNKSPLRENTKRTYISLFKRWIYPYDPWIEAHINNNFGDLIDDWAKYNLSPATVKTLLQLLKKYIKFTYNYDLDIRDTTKQILRSQQEDHVKALNHSDSSILLNTCEAKDKELYLPVLIALHTGMRRGEIFGLRWEDIDFKNKYIWVKRSYNGPTKSGKTRKIPMSAILKNELAKREKNGDNLIERKFDPNPRLKKICEKASIPIVTIHMLRHTFATQALEAGKSPRLVQQVLGHSKVSTTTDLYWSATQEDLDLDFL